MIRSPELRQMKAGCTRSQWGWRVLRIALVLHPWNYYSEHKHLPPILLKIYEVFPLQSKDISKCSNLFIRPNKIQNNSITKLKIQVSLKNLKTISWAFGEASNMKSFELSRRDRGGGTINFKRTKSEIQNSYCLYVFETN